MYWCSLFVLPKQILKDINTVLKRFLWTGTDLKKIGAKVAWADVKGGLGIKDLCVD